MMIERDSRCRKAKRVRKKRLACVPKAVRRRKEHAKGETLVKLPKLGLMA